MLIVYTRMYDLCIGHKISPSCNMSTLFGSSLGEGGEFSRPTKRFVSGGGEENPRNAAVQQELIELSQNMVTIYSIIYYCLQSWTAGRRHSNPFSFLSHTHTQGRTAPASREPWPGSFSWAKSKLSVSCWQIYPSCSELSHVWHCTAALWELTYII